MNIRHALLLTTAIAASLTLVACGGDPTPTPGQGQPTLVRVELSEWTVSPQVNRSGSGTVNFLAVNVGALEHELIVLSSDLPASDLPVVDAKVDEAAAGTVVGEIGPSQLQPGGQASDTWEMESGAYVLFCNIAGHYDLGMRAGFTIVN